MIIAFKTYFYDGYGYTVGGVFDTWADDKIRYYIINKKKCTDTFGDKELWREKTSCIMECLSMFGLNIASDNDQSLNNSINTIVIDDYIWLGEGEKGVGAILFSMIKNRYDFEMNIVGVTKKPHNGKIDDCFEISRYNSEQSMYITCINPNFAEHYSFLVANMDGKGGTPKLLDLIDKKAKKLISNVSETSLDNIDESEDVKLNCKDLDKWAEENLSTKEFNRYMMSKPIE